MSGLLQRIGFGDDYRGAWERAVRENPACGFMQSLTWAEVQRARKSRSIRGSGFATAGSRAGRSSWPPARSTGRASWSRREVRSFPGTTRLAVPYCSPRSAARRCRLRQRTAASLHGGSSPVSLPHCRPINVGSSAALVDLDLFETNEVDPPGGMVGVLARMTSKGAGTMSGSPGGMGSKSRCRRTHQPAPRFHPLLDETAARQGFAAEPLCYVMDLAATLFPARMAAAFFAAYRGDYFAGAAIVRPLRPSPTYLERAQPAGAPAK